MDGKKKILELLSNGAITKEEAKKFLKIYDAYEKSKEENKTKAFKRLNIKISNTEDNDKVLVNVSIPMEFIGLIKTSKIYNKLKEYDLDVDYIINASKDGFTGTLIELKTSSGHFILVTIN